jgi:anti-sigma-K factor RskA
MTCAELKEQLGALAAGALEPAEREACERHLALDIPHEGCHEALALANDAAALIGAALAPIEPGPNVWRGIEAEIGMRQTATPRRPHWAQRARWMVAGFTVAAVAASALIFAFSEHNLRAQVEEVEGKFDQLDRQAKGAQAAAASCQRDLATARADLNAQKEALAMVQLSTTAVIALAPQGGARMRASALYNAAQGHAMVVASGLLPHPGKDYELWIIRGKDKIAAGLLHGDPSGATVARIDAKLLASGAPDAFAVTLEPAGGGTAPRGPIMLVGALSKG